VKLSIWDSEQAPKELARRLGAAKKARAPLEYHWSQTERVCYQTSSNGGFFTDESSWGLLGNNGTDEGGVNPTLSVSYCMKNIRFLHSQMSANPPSALARPNSSDQKDKRAADAANRILDFGKRKYKFQNRQDIVNLHTLVYGTGIGKTEFDPDAGLPIAFNPEDDTVEFEGDFTYAQPHPRNMYLDPDATDTDSIRWVFERVYMPYEEALRRFPESHDKIKSLMEQAENQRFYHGDASESYFQFQRFQRLPIFQYWENGTPENGLQGRFAWCLEDGTVLTRSEDGRAVPVASPYAFPVYADVSEETIGTYARLPYHFLTDIDIPGTAWGMPVVAYAVQLQDLLNHLDIAAADIIQAHGVARVLVPDSAELAQDAINNNSWDVVVYAGQQPPKFMEPLPFPQALPVLRQQVKQAIDDIFGVTELAMGQQARETSGNSMQFAVEQSNVVRRRLFNKLTMYVESVYQDYLSLCATNWTTPRTIKTIGREQAMETLDIKGSDIRSGYDLHVEFGTQFSLDPIQRRMEIMQLAPFFKEAGIPMRQILSMMKLSDLSSLYDAAQLAESRQREYFDEIINTGRQVPPGAKEDHVNMLNYALHWRMTSEFFDLPTDLQQLCLEHITLREELMASETKPAAPAGQPPAAGTPQSGVAPAENPLAALAGLSM
jgi:hypothetical protein